MPESGAPVSVGRTGDVPAVCTVTSAALALGTSARAASDGVAADGLMKLTVVSHTAAAATTVVTLRVISL
jgi:hypothetical protein